MGLKKVVMLLRFRGLQHSGPWKLVLLIDGVTGCHTRSSTLYGSQIFIKPLRCHQGHWCLTRYIQPDAAYVQGTPIYSYLIHYCLQLTGAGVSQEAHDKCTGTWSF